MKIAESKQEHWQTWKENNTDPYGSAILEYAGRWADLMESKLSEGESLEAIAESLSHEADTEGITGFMYGAAVTVLSDVWEHGEQLRRWHNLATQIRDEGEKANESGDVLNPAMMGIRWSE